MAPYQLLLQLMPGHQHTPDWQWFNFLRIIYVGQIRGVYIYYIYICIYMYMYIHTHIHAHIYIYYKMCICLYVCGFYIHISYILLPGFPDVLNKYYKALIGVHLSLIWPVWARFNIKISRTVYVLKSQKQSIPVTGHYWSSDIDWPKHWKY